MAFKDNFRIEKIYFQRVKDDAQILGSWKTDPRRYSDEEISRIAKDACDSILMLYRLIGECWNDALNQIEKLSAELEALAGKAEAYHDELNEKIDEVNNYLNSQIKNIEAQIDAFGGLPSNANASEGDVLTVGANGVNEWREGGDKHYTVQLIPHQVGEETQYTVNPLFNLTQTLIENFAYKIRNSLPIYFFVLTILPAESYGGEYYLTRASNFVLNDLTEDNVRTIQISFVADNTLQNFSDHIFWEMQIDTITHEILENTMSWFA